MADIEKFVYYDNGSKKVLKPTDRIVVGSGGLAFEGSTSDDFELQLTVTDPTDDRTINFPDEDGDIALLQGDALPKALSFPVKNPSTTTALTKGQLVYISGHSGNKPEVSLAQSNSSATMPAFGFVQSDIAAEAEGYVVYSGLFKGIDTNVLYSEGDTLYVSSTTAGEFQNTPPTGSNLIQNIGKIVKSDANNGEVLVGGAGRTNATPNLSEGKFFIGNASNQSSESSYQFPTSIGTSGQVLASNGTNIVFQDASGSYSQTEITANITASNLQATTYYIGPQNETSFDIELPNWWDYDTLTDSLENKRIIIHNEGSVGITLTAVNYNRVNVSGNNDYYNRLYDLEGNLVSVSNNEQVLTIPARTSILIDLEKYYNSSVNLYNHFSYWRTYYYVDKSLSNLTDTSISSLSNRDIISYNSSTSQWENSSDRRELEYSFQNSDFTAEPGYYYYVNSSSGDINVTLSSSTPTVVGSRFKVFKATSANSVIVQEQNAINTIDPDDDAVYGTSRSIQARSLIEFVVTTTSADYTYIITPQVELNSTDLTDSGEFLIYDAAAGAKHLTTAAYKLPMSDGSSNQVLKTNGLGQLAFSDISIVEDTTPQLGGTLDLNSQAIQGSVIPSAADTYDLGSVSAEWANIFLGDDAEIKFGLGQDVVIKHIHNSGLRVEMSPAQVANDEPNFTLYSTKETGFTTGPKLSLQSKFVDNSEVIGGLDFKAGDFTTPVIYAESNAQIKSNSSSLEEGKYEVKVVCSGLLQTGLSIEPLNNSSTPSVKISDNYYLPNSSISEGQILKGSATSGETTFGKLSDTIIAELSIPGLDLQTDTNAFRFNCPVDIDIVGLDLYLDQHSTSGDVTVTVTNTTTSSSIQSLTISGTSLSANAYPYTTASAGDVITFAITATPANAQGLRAVLHIERKA